MSSPMSSLLLITSIAALLRVGAAGETAREARFDGQKLFEMEDSTFTGPGQVGVWTKADSVTHFDDLKLTVLE